MTLDPNSTDFFETARRECPSHFSVTVVAALFPGVIAAGTIHNAISAGVGPEHRKVNGRVVLERESFISWLLNRPKMPKRTGIGTDRAA